MRYFKRRYLFGIILLLIPSNLALIGPAVAGTITSSGSSVYYGRASLGQSLTMPVGESGLLTSITVPGVRARTPFTGCIQAKFYTNSSKTTLLRTSSNSICDTDSSGTEFGGTAASGAFEFGNVVSLTSGTQYFFELTPTSGATDFWTSQSYSSPNGNYSGGQLFADGAFQPGYDMAFTLTYTSADTTAPSFTSSATFSAAENIATSSNAAIIKVSESATLTISGGVDSSRFNIITSDSVTAFIRFKNSPNFEAPVDVGTNNAYEITIRAEDGAANIGTQAITITVTDLIDTSAFNSVALAGSVTTATYRTSIAITANISVASKVTFRVNSKSIPGCINKSATGSGSDFSVICNWKPSTRGIVKLTVSATPTDLGISGTTTNPISIIVSGRNGTR